VTDSNIAILGADFLTNNLIVYLNSKRLIQSDCVESNKVDANVTPKFLTRPMPGISFKTPCSNPENYRMLLNNFLSLLTFNKPVSYAATTVRHVIK